MASPHFFDAHGLDFWDYLSAYPEEGAHFDGAMSGAVVMRAEALLAARDLSGIGTLVDIGGGHGRLLAAALEANSGLRAVLFDRPEVLAGAEATLAAAGLRDRCELVGGDFFVEAVPGGDVNGLSQILHDRPDAEAMAILRTWHRAMAPGARLWIIEQVVEPGDAFDWVKLLDLLMLVNFGAQERTAEEYRSLLEATGFRDMTVHATPTIWNVIEAVRAEPATRSFGSPSVKVCRSSPVDRCGYGDPVARRDYDEANAAVRRATKAVQAEND